MNLEVVMQVNSLMTWSSFIFIYILYLYFKLVHQPIRVHDISKNQITNQWELMILHSASSQHMRRLA